MKMRILSGKLAAAVVGCMMAASAHAVTVTLNLGLGSANVLGEVILNGNFTAPPGGQADRDLTMVNTLVGIYNGTVTQVDPYHLSANNLGPAPLPSATLTGDVVTPAGGMQTAPDGNITYTLGTGYRYLIAAYDGKNSGAIVWDISGLAAGTVLEFSPDAQPNAAGTDLIAGKYGITTWTLFKPTTTDRNVPDGGSTLMLLGAGLVGLFWVRRAAFARN